MRVYYLDAEYETGKHKIVEVWAEFWGLTMPDAHIKEPYSILEFDEFYNHQLAQRLIHNNRAFYDLPDKFYVDGNGNLREQDGTLVTGNPNPQKEEYKLSALYGLTQAQLETYIENNVANLTEAKEFLKKLSAVVLWLVKQSRLEE